MADETNKDTSDTGSTKKSFIIEPDIPKRFNQNIKEISDRALNLARGKEQGIVNEQTGSSVNIREDGLITLSSGIYSNYKLSPSGRSAEVTLESVTRTNRKTIFTDDLTINNHKLNPQLWEMADMRKANLPLNKNALVGNLCMNGSVLVKAWEPDLKRYMLIRRPWRGPIFGPLLNVPEINSALNIDDPTKVNEDILALSDKGYQVNALITDKASLIGKEGVDRAGIIRNQDAISSSTTGGTSGNVQVTMAVNLSASEIKGIFEFFKSNGYDEIAACGAMGRLQQEHGFQTNDVPVTTTSGGLEVGGFGIAQWNGARITRIKNWISEHNMQANDLNAQLSALVWEARQFYSMPGNINGCSSVEEACSIWTSQYEGGVPSTNEITYAKQFYNQCVTKK